MLMSCFSVCLTGKLCCLLEREKGFIKEKPDRKRELLCVFRLQGCFWGVWDCLCCVPWQPWGPSSGMFKDALQAQGVHFPVGFVQLWLFQSVFNSCFYTKLDSAVQWIPVFSQNNSEGWSLSVSTPSYLPLDSVLPHSVLLYSWNFVGLFISNILTQHLWYYHILKLSL